MTDPAQQAAARAALKEGAAELGVGLREVTVIEVERRRRRDTKIPFYYVTVCGPRGDYRRYQVSDDGSRVEPASRR